MKDSNLDAQEADDKSLIEDVLQLQQFSFGDGAVVCEVCGEKFRGDTPVVVFAAACRALTCKPWQRPVVRANNADQESPSDSDLGSKDGETAETTAPHTAACSGDDGDEGCGDDAGDGGDAEEDLDELQPVSTSLRTALEREGEGDRSRGAAGGGR